MLFHAAVYLYKRLLQAEATGLPHGISFARCASCLATVAGEVGAFKTARLVFEKLHELFLPSAKRVRSGLLANTQAAVCCMCMLLTEVSQ